MPDFGFNSNMVRLRAANKQNADAGKTSFNSNMVRLRERRVRSIGI
ncbi:hypothetical protein PORCAN_1223 [Porphyromonas crevioricanis JCM 13913]|nr:hypothetical protein PORCAN_1223 [Porphyromonas crevioricanis JCM 13913]